MNGGGKALAASNAARRAEREQGLAYARRWREENRARFDALYPETAPCPTCGKRP